MTNPPSKTGPQSWPKRQVLLFASKEKKNFKMMLRKLLTIEEWTIAESADNLQEFLVFLTSSPPDMVIISDTDMYSAAEITKTLLLQIPVVRLTPTLICDSDAHPEDCRYLEQVFKIPSVPKPFAPNQFTPKFKEILRTWEQPLYGVFRHIRGMILEHGEHYVKPALAKACYYDDAGCIAAQALVAIGFGNGQGYHLERLLLEVALKNRGNMGVLNAIGDFYLKSLCLTYAEKYFGPLKKAFPESSLLEIDLYQLYFMRGDFIQAAECLKKLTKHMHMSDRLDQMMAKICVAAGRHRSKDAEAIRLKNKIDRLESEWAAVETESKEGKMPFKEAS